MQIGEFSKICNLSRETIRFYEGRGLISGERKENNYRNYTEKDFKVVNFISSMKDLGFTLPAIKEILDIYYSHQSCKTLQSKLEKNLDQIQEKIEILERIKKNLTISIKLCEQNPNKKSCNILIDLLS